MFESTGKMSIPALSSFVTALRQVSDTFVSGFVSSSNSTFSTVSGSAANNVTGQAVVKMWAVERMLRTLMFNVHRKSRLELCNNRRGLFIKHLDVYLQFPPDSFS